MNKLVGILQNLFKKDDATKDNAAKSKKKLRGVLSILSKCIITLGDLVAVFVMFYNIVPNLCFCPIYRRHFVNSLIASLNVVSDGDRRMFNFIKGIIMIVITAFLTIKLTLDFRAGKLDFFSAVFFIGALLLSIGALKHNWQQASLAIIRANDELTILIETGELEALEQAGNVTIELFSNKIQLKQAAEEKAQREAEAAKRAEEAAKAEADKEAEQQAKAVEAAQTVAIVMQLLKEQPDFLQSILASQSPQPAQPQQTPAPAPPDTAPNAP